MTASNRVLVLGGGGRVSTAWMAGLQRAGADPGRADRIIGTSAGAIVGAALAVGRDLGLFARPARAESPARGLPPPDPARMEEVFTTLATPGLDPGEARRRKDRARGPRPGIPAYRAGLAGAGHCSRRRDQSPVGERRRSTLTWLAAAHIVPIAVIGSSFERDCNTVHIGGSRSSPTLRFVVQAGDGCARAATDVRSPARSWQADIHATSPPG
jgi:hypothetical protein